MLRKRRPGGQPLGKEECCAGIAQGSDSLLRIGQRQVDRAPFGAAPVDRLGKLHVPHAVRERGQTDRLLPADRADKLLLDAPRAQLLLWNIDRPELSVAFARSAKAVAVLLEAER